MTKRKSNVDAPHQPTTASPPPTRYIWLGHRPWFLALVLAVVTFVAYQPVWHAGFIWDDDDHLTANPAMTAPHGLRMIWSSLAVSRYYPLTLTGFWVQRRLWGLNPLPYHLVNVAFHAANGVLVFFLLRRLRVRAAWLAAMLWALHPVNVESVAWITELKNTQSGLFFFLAVLCFLRFETDARRRWYGLALACGLAALLSKPSTVILPMALLLCVWWERGSWRRADILRIAPFFLLSLGMSALTVIEQRGDIQRVGTAEWNLRMAERFVLAGKAVWFYASKALWPARLTFVYPHWKLDAGSFWSWLPLAGLVIVGVLLWVWGRQSWARAGLFGCGFFVLALLPVLGFFDVYYFRFSYVADHFQYLASLGLISLAASVGTAVSERAGQRGRDLGTVAAAMALLILGVATWKQARIYQDLKTLWGDTLRKNPRCWMAYNNLGPVLEDEGRIQEAIGCYQQALRLWPDYPEAHGNLGNLLLQTGKTEEAIAQYKETLRLWPNSLEAHYNLGNVLLQTGKTEDAIAQYKEALRLRPDYADAHYNLGNALMQVGKVNEAIGHYEQALRTKSGYVDAVYHLADALGKVGRVEEAITRYEQALRLQPGNATAHNNVGLLYAAAGKLREAIAQYREALRLKPDYANAENNLAWLLATTERSTAQEHEEAIQLATRANELAGGKDPGYLDTLAAACAAAGRFSEAVTNAQQAIELARSGGRTELADEIASRLELYRAGCAYHEPIPVPR